MELIETKAGRTSIRVRYDVENEVTRGEVYSKAEEVGKEVQVAYVTDEVTGTGTLHVLPQFKGKQYIEEDFEELRTEFAAISNMWAARKARGWC